MQFRAIYDRDILEREAEGSTRCRVARHSWQVTRGISPENRAKLNGIPGRSASVVKLTPERKPSQAFFIRAYPHGSLDPAWGNAFAMIPP